MAVATGVKIWFYMFAVTNLRNKSENAVEHKLHRRVTEILPLQTIVRASKSGIVVVVADCCCSVAVVEIFIVLRVIDYGVPVTGSIDVATVSASRIVRRTCTGLRTVAD